jgi:hypothetical protein
LGVNDAERALAEFFLLEEELNSLEKGGACVESTKRERRINGKKMIQK